LKILEDENPPSSKRSNYEIKIDRKISWGEGHTWWHQEEATYEDRKGNHFKSDLKDFMQIGMGFELDEHQKTL
jgi:hypothetical protein